MHNYRRLLRFFLLIAFVYFMLCPYAMLLSAGYVDHLLINQYNDIKKIKKIIKNDVQHFDLHPLFKSHPHGSVSLSEKSVLLLCSSMHQSIGLAMYTTARLLL
jgi:hypothetical protein